MYRVFRLPAARASEADVLLKDDIVSRQSVVARDARSLGLSRDDHYVIVEGSDAGVARAVELLKGIAASLEGSAAEDIYRRIRSQEDEAASGMGFIFGA